MHSLFKGVFVLLAFVVLASCSPAPEPKCQSDTVEEAKKAERALADFAINIYKNASADQQHRDKNQVISPISIALALALLENGANGQTRRQLQQQLLEQQGASQEVLSVYRALEQQLRIRESKTRLEIANGIFVDRKAQLKQEYERSTKQCLEAEIEKADFQNQLEQTREKINQFISQKTSRKVPELLKKGQLKSDAKIVLANAVYFKAAWERSFDKKNTKQQPFYQRGREQDRQQVPTMKVEGEYRHSSDDKLQVVELRYDQAEISMYVLLPKQRDGLKELEQRLNGEQLRSILGRLSTKKVEIQLPKFEIRAPLNLKPILSKMGLRSIFEREADLSRLSEEKLEISEAVHEAYIKVDEYGTEAAAASAAVAENFAAGAESTKFIADHPFLYTIVHHPTGAVVFIGKVNEVQEKSDE